MAFKRDNLDPSASGSSGLARGIYRTTDTLAVVETAGYFNSAWSLMRGVSALLVLASNGAREYRLTVQPDSVALSLLFSTGGLAAAGGVYSGPLIFDNGTDPVIPTVTEAGIGGVRIGGVWHLRFFPDLDGDGDYDADMWSKDNMYLAAGAGIHLRLGLGAGASDEGRVVLKAENGTNYIQSARNYSGSQENDLVISKYNSSYAWLMFDVSQNGWAGFGYNFGEAPPARLSVKDSAATVGYIENTGSSIARMAFKGSTTSAATTVCVGANGDDLELRGSGAAQVRVNSVGMYPYFDNLRILGSASFRWSTIYAGTAAINTSDEREKQDIVDLGDAERRVAVRLKGMIKRFLFRDAVAEKGDGARYHFGVIAQEVITAFEAEGIDASRYALLCYDEWEAVEAQVDADGEIVPARPAGNRYGIRYEELLAFIIATL